MVIVAVETSSSIAGVAIVDGASVLAEASIQIDTVYAEQLPVMLDRALADARMPVDRADGFAVSIGPGSYTGLRVGVSLAKGLAYAVGKPLVAVPTLDTVAYGLPYCRYPVCVALDARRERVYTATYRTDRGMLERQTPYQAVALNVLLDTIETRTLFAGSGAAVYRKRIQARLGDLARFLPDGLGVLSAVPVALLSLESFRRGDYVSLYEIEPLYLQRPDFVTGQPVRHV